jgi:hypothetical protein
MPLDLSNPRVATSIELLENDIEIKAIQKALIIRVAMGKKPATWQVIESEKWKKGTHKTGIGSERWNHIDRLLSGLGLQYVVTTRLSDDTFVQSKIGEQFWVEIGDVFIARTKETATQLADAARTKDDKRLGELFGFPDTAISAYISKDLIPFHKIPKFTDDITSEEMKFLNHMISKQNWKTEILYLPEFASDIRHISPKIYHDCVS